MSQQKKEIRNIFRNKVHQRDRWTCVTCGQKKGNFDAHHITDRNQMPFGGYVVENGITLCNPCHERAEEFHQTGEAPKGFSPEELYQKIGSSYDKAYEASLKLEKRK